MNRIAALTLALVGAVGCGACSGSDRPPIKNDDYEGQGPAQLRFPELRLAGAVSEPARVTANGAADLDGTDDARWSAAVRASPDGLTDAFVANAGTATVSVDVQAQDGAGNVGRLRLRVRLSAE